MVFATRRDFAGFSVLLLVRLKSPLHSQCVSRLSWINLANNFCFGPWLFRWVKRTKTTAEEDQGNSLWKYQKHSTTLVAFPCPNHGRPPDTDYVRYSNGSSSHNRHTRVWSGFWSISGNLEQKKVILGFWCCCFSDAVFGVKNCVGVPSHDTLANPKVKG